MSATPRTDLSVYHSRATGMEIVNAGFARKLERENTELKNALRKIAEGKTEGDPRWFALAVLQQMEGEK